MGKEFDPSSPSNFIFYVDCNNLYGLGMSLPLTYDDWHWVDDEKVAHFDVMQVPDDSHRGYVLQVDLDYDSSLHDEHNDYPLAPEKMTVGNDMLSEFGLGLFETTPDKKRVASEKLVGTLSPKKNYIVHYRTLKLYLQLGLKIYKIHKILAFEQKNFLKPYIDMNTKKRAQAKNDWEKKFFKLMNNSVFGKTLENLRNRCDIRLVHTSNHLERLVARSSFKRFEIIHEDLVAIELMKVNLKLNRPVYLGQAILDLSKYIMVDFHYNFMKKKFGKRIELCFTDTNSYLYDIKSTDLYQEIADCKNSFDFSNYPPDNPLYDVTNKKVLGKFKDEAAGSIISSFVGLKPKLYSYQIRKTTNIPQEDGSERKITSTSETCRAKGIVKRTVETDLRFQHYKQCLFSLKEMNCKMYSIRSLKHRLTVQKFSKLALSCADDKRYILPDNINTLAFGHFRIPQKGVNS